VVAGAEGNTISPGTSGATISGGGDNTVSESLATIGGGTNNGAGGYAATVGGGSGNSIAFAYHATVAGGYDNEIGQGSLDSVISGGYDNDISSNAPRAVIAGGAFNRIGPITQYNVIGGGAHHDITSDFASTSANQFLIRASGGVGIGTDAPAQELDVEGDAQADRFLAGNGTAGSPVFSFAADSNTGVFSPVNTGNSLAFTFAGTERVRMHSNGYLGLGTTAPAQRFHLVHNSTPAIIDRVGSDGFLIRFYWDEVSETTDGVKHRRISILFGAFVRDNLQARERVAALETRIAALEELLAGAGTPVSSD
jgi:hypothetical protein